MSKHSISTRETQVSTGDAIGKQVEQTVSVDDLSLPTAQELKAYQEINPNIVDFLLETTRKEQEHRHKMENMKMEVIHYSEHKNGRMNWWGMFFAFLSLVFMVVLSAFALYLDLPWFAGIFGFSTVAAIVTIFVNAGKDKELPKK